jgi:hypothetical protein
MAAAEAHILPEFDAPHIASMRRDDSGGSVCRDDGSESPRRDEDVANAPEAACASRGGVPCSSAPSTSEPTVLAALSVRGSDGVSGDHEKLDGSMRAGSTKASAREELTHEGALPSSRSAKASATDEDDASALSTSSTKLGAEPEKVSSAAPASSKTGGSKFGHLFGGSSARSTKKGVSTDPVESGGALDTSLEPGYGAASGASLAPMPVAMASQALAGEELADGPPVKRDRSLSMKDDGLPPAASRERAMSLKDVSEEGAAAEAEEAEAEPAVSPREAAESEVKSIASELAAAREGGTLGTAAVAGLVSRLKELARAFEREAGVACVLLPCRDETGLLVSLNAVLLAGTLPAKLAASAALCRLYEDDGVEPSKGVERISAVIFLDTYRSLFSFVAEHAANPKGKETLRTLVNVLALLSRCTATKARGGFGSATVGKMLKQGAHDIDAPPAHAVPTCRPPPLSMDLHPQRQADAPHSSKTRASRTPIPAACPS